MKPVIAWELRRRRVFLMGWSIGLTVLIAMTVLSYAAVRDQADELNKAFGSLSSDASSFVGSSDLFSPIGFMNSQLYCITLPILFIIMAIVLANGLIGKEENNRTLELLLSRPISRTKLLAAKAVAATVIFTIVGAVTAVVTIACAAAVQLELSVAHLMLATAGSIVFSAAFGAIAFMLLAASFFTRRLAILVAVALSLGSYIITSLAGLADWLDTIAKVLPYHYYNPEKMLQGELTTGFVAYTLAMYAVAIVVSILGFRRRDIN